MLAYNTQPLEDLHLLAAKTDPPTRLRLLRCFILRTSLGLDNAQRMHSVVSRWPQKSLQTAKPLRLPSLDAYGQHFPHLC